MQIPSKEAQDNQEVPYRPKACLPIRGQGMQLNGRDLLLCSRRHHCWWAYEHIDLGGQTSNRDTNSECLVLHFFQNKDLPHDVDNEVIPIRLVHHLLERLKALPLRLSPAQVSHLAQVVDGSATQESNIVEIQLPLQCWDLCG